VSLDVLISGAIPLTKFIELRALWYGSYSFDAGGKLMATQERIEFLTQCCERWRERSNSAAKYKDELIFAQTNGLLRISSDGADQMLMLIDEADNAAKHYQKIQTYMEEFRAKVISGEVN